MDIEAMNGAGVVAITSAILFLLVARAWASLSRRVGSGPNFADSIMHEAAQRLRIEFDRLSTSQSIYLGGAFVFTVLFAAAYILEAGQLFAGYPDWQLQVQLGFLFFAAAFALYQLGTTVAKRQQIQFTRDASIAIGHQLQNIAHGNSTTFHDCETGAGLIDHVVISRTGLYAVSVVAKRPCRSGTVHFNDNALVFSAEEDHQAVADIIARAHYLADDFQQLLGYKVRVRSVIAVPGWKVIDPVNEGLLVASENDISKLTDWKSDAELLMHDDVDRLIEAMTAKSVRSAELVSV